MTLVPKKVGSLFSGIGGIEIGFEAEGFDTEWFVENELYAQEILKKRFPNAKIYGDITELDFTTVPTVDILTGGFPCQDISNAGKRAGIEGSRSSLWKYYCEAIRVLQPKYALIENVSALAGRGLNVVLADLASIGYDAEWYNISASAVGALHRRERIFIIAHPCGDGFNTPERLGKQRDKNNIQRNSEKILDNQTREEIKQQFEFKQDGFDRDVPDSSSIRSKTHKQPFRNETQHAGFTTSNNGTKQGWWATEPDVGRVAHGVPNRVDRIKCLGNAVVPQVAQVFAKTIRRYYQGE